MRSLYLNFSLSDNKEKKTLLVESMEINSALFSGSFCVSTELGVLMGAASCFLNLVAMMKKERIRNAISTKGVISVSVLFLGILTLGIIILIYGFR
jgi:hypothetical protein